MRVRSGRGVRLEQRDDVLGRELLPDHRPALEHRALAGAEPVEARGEQRLHRLGKPALGETALEREREELLEEERIPLRGLDDAGALIRLENGSAETVEQRIRLPPESASSWIRSAFARSSRNYAVVEQLLARETDHAIGPSPLSARCSTSSRNVGSAQWTSSRTRTSGSLARARLAELAEEPCELGRGRRCLGVERREDSLALVALAACASDLT